MTTKEYLNIFYEYPFIKDYYDGQEEDMQKIIKYNKELCGKYPFLIPRDIYSDEIVKNYDYSFTYLDEMPDGWRISFGLDMIDEIKQALIEVNYLDEYRIMQIKENQGVLVWHGNNISNKLNDIIQKYKIKSRSICITCGKPAKYINKDWDSPFCEKCARIIVKEYKHIENKYNINECFKQINI